jgi:phosphatidylserine/phosphatidylglycerophosphate/cardiolipin synthase-like enzyme
MGPRYGARPPWHDAALELRGPVVADLLAIFAERWNDPNPLDRRTPYRMLLQRLARMPRHPAPLPETAPPPPAAGPHAVQLLRTYGIKHPPFPFAPAGERSVARAYGKAFARARSLIYIEDQYLWSTEVTATLADALERNPDLNVIVVVPRYPSSDGPLSGPASRIGQLRAIGMLRRIAPARVGVFDLENAVGTPIYIHAKICIVDDTWMTCGSDNFNRRSWTTDSELTCAVLDTADRREPLGMDTGREAPAGLARDLRSELWAEHLGLDRTDPRLHDPAAGLAPPTLSIAGTRPAAVAPGPPDGRATTIPNPSRASNGSGRPRSTASSWTRMAAPGHCAEPPSSSAAGRAPGRRRPPGWVGWAHEVASPSLRQG